MVTVMGNLFSVPAVTSLESFWPGDDHLCLSESCPSGFRLWDRHGFCYLICPGTWKSRVMSLLVVLNLSVAFDTIKHSNRTWGCCARWNPALPRVARSEEEAGQFLFDAMGIGLQRLLGFSSVPQWWGTGRGGPEIWVSMSPVIGWHPPLLLLSIQIWENIKL